MKLKKKKKYRSRSVTFRLSEKEYNQLKQRALVYSEGRVSEFIRYALKNYEIHLKDLEN